MVSLLQGLLMLPPEPLQEASCLPTITVAELDSVFPQLRMLTDTWELPLATYMPIFSGHHPRVPAC